MAMRWLSKISLRLRSLFHRQAVEHELDQELHFHLEQQIELNVSAGMPRLEARRAALREFGGVEQMKEECRDMRGVSWIQDLAQDLRYGLRLLRKSPGFTGVAVITLALGIGANTAIFSVANAVIFRPLPYDHPQTLVGIETRNVKQPELDLSSSADDFFDLREHAKSFHPMAAISPLWNVVVRGERESERVQALYVSAEMFPMLGVHPVAGRGFLPEEDDRKAPAHVVMLSHEYWRRRFGGNPSAVGQSLTADGALYTIVGVLPAGFEYLGGLPGGGTGDAELWFPLASNQLINIGRAVRFLSVMARLQPGITMAQATAEMESVWAGMAAQYPDTDRGFEVRVTPLEDQAVGGARPALLVLLGVVGFVLLIACANVANLLLARTMARSKEIAVRKALGAGVGRLVRQLLTESLVLAALGGIAGMLCALWGVRALVASFPRRAEIGIDAEAFVFAFLIVVVSGILCGLAPIIEVARRDFNASLKLGGRSAHTGSARLRSTLIVGETALAMVLLAGAGLLVHSFARLLQVSPGFLTENVVTLSTQVPVTDEGNPARRAALCREIESRLRAIPGVQAEGVVSRLPLLGANLGSYLLIEGHPFPPNERPDVEYRIASTTYFATLGIPLLRGRLYDQRDAQNPGDVAVINQTMARRYWRDDDPIGKRIKLGRNPDTEPWITIVGVIGDVHHVGLDITPRAEVYRPFEHNPLYSPIFVVRAQRDARSLIPALREQFRNISAELAVYNVFTMQDLVDRSMAHRRFPMLLLSGFALLAVLLAAVGIYGVISQSVSQQTQEIGVRMALGGTVADMMRMVLGQGLRLALLGTVIGVAAAAGLTRLMNSLLFGVSATDLAVFLLAPLGLMLVAALACTVPAYRASRVDPMIALRHE